MWSAAWRSNRTHVVPAPWWRWAPPRPSCFPSIALLTLFGTLAVLARIGLGSSAATESASASLAPTTVGTMFDGPGYNLSVFAVAFMAMSMSCAMWMISTLVLTPILRRSDSKLRAVNPSLMAIVSAAALIGAFQPRHRGARQDSGTHRHVVDVTRLYVFPSIIGPVLVQLIVTIKQPRGRSSPLSSLPSSSSSWFLPSRPPLSRPSG
jgi:hypothetical protein